MHPYNAPKYHALLKRASIFAQAKQRILLWVVAHDDPGRTDAGALKGPALQRQRDRWLQLHDKQTGGIMGLLPCVRGLPMRFTETVDREKRIFKNTRGVLEGWELSDLDAERVRDERSDGDRERSRDKARSRAQSALRRARASRTMSPSSRERGRQRVPPLSNGRATNGPCAEPARK